MIAGASPAWLVARNGDPPISAVLGFCQVMAAKPRHHRARQEITFGILGARGIARVLVDVGVISESVCDRINQQLTGEPDTGIAAGDRRASRQIAAGTVPGD